MYLTRSAQREYLREKHGIELAESALENKAHRGEGPQYTLINGRAVSTPEWLDKWIAEVTARNVRQRPPPKVGRPRRKVRRPERRVAP